MDFSLKTSSELTGSMVMELLPGPYDGRVNNDEAIFIGDEAFEFLEPSIRQFCPAFGEYAHWGVTEVTRDQWKDILHDWEYVRDDLTKPHHDELAAMIQLICDWLHAVLENYDCVSVVGH